MAGDSIPENIALPENINLQIAFKGEVKSFETRVIAAAVLVMFNFLRPSIKVKISVLK